MKSIVKSYMLEATMNFICIVSYVIKATALFMKDKVGAIHNSLIF